MDEKMTPSDSESEREAPEKGKAPTLGRSCQKSQRRPGSLGRPPGSPGRPPIPQGGIRRLAGQPPRKPGKFPRGRKAGQPGEHRDRGGHFPNRRDRGRGGRVRQRRPPPRLWPGLSAWARAKGQTAPAPLLRSSAAGHSGSTRRKSAKNTVKTREKPQYENESPMRSGNDRRGKLESFPLPRSRYRGARRRMVLRKTRPRESQKNAFSGYRGAHQGRRRDGQGPGGTRQVQGRGRRRPRRGGHGALPPGSSWILPNARMAAKRRVSAGQAQTSLDRGRVRAEVAPEVPPSRDAPSSGGHSGLAKYKRQTKSMRNIFECRQCGRCCLNLVGASQTSCRDEDWKRWRKEKRSDILIRIEPIIVRGKVFTRDMWFKITKNKRRGEMADRCPWLRKKGDIYTCRIHATKPGHCREFIPSPEFAKLIGCQGWDDEA